MLHDDDFVDFGTRGAPEDRPTRAWYAQAAGVFGGVFAAGLAFVAFAVTGGIGASFGVGQADAREGAAIVTPVSYEGGQGSNSYWFDAMLHNVAARDAQDEAFEIAELTPPYEDIEGIAAEPLEGAAPAEEETQITVMGFSGEDQEPGFDGSQGPFSDPEALPVEEFTPPKRPEPAPAYVAVM
jgi:hypothetical protein